MQAKIPFPPPPVAGSGDIQPLTSAVMLQEEGQTMCHCVGDGEYAGAVRRGECYIYKVLRPVRATLEIRPSGFGQWEAHQIKGYSNAKVGRDTAKAVRAWLAQYSLNCEAEQWNADAQHVLNCELRAATYTLKVR